MIDSYFESNWLVSHNESRSIEDLLFCYDSLSAEGKIHCKVCHKESGSFDYDFSEGTTFSSDTEMTTGFLMLKEAIQRHFISESHAEKVSEEKKESGVKCLYDIGYLLLQGTWRVKFFNDMVQLCTLNGLELQKVHHPKHTLQQMKNGYFVKIMSFVKEFCAAASSISWVANKVTINYCLVDIITIIAINPDAEPGKLIQSIVIAAPFVDEDDSMENQWIEAAKKFSVNSSKLVAIATNFEDLRNGIPRKFLNQLDVETVENHSNVGVMCCADLIDVIRNEIGACPLFRNISHTIGEITKLFVYEKLGMEGHEMSRHFVCPENFKETNWNTHPTRYCKQFLRNAGIYYDVLEENFDGPCSCLAIIKPKRATVSYFLKNFDECQMKAAAIIDILGVSSKRNLSQNLQDMPWDRISEFDMISKKLQRLLDNIRSKNIKHWKNLKEYGKPSSKLVLQIEEAIRILLKKLKLRKKEFIAKSTAEGSTYEALQNNMELVQILGDLKAARNCNCTSSARASVMSSAFAILKEKTLLAGTLTLTQESIEVSINIMKDYKPREEVGNQELYKALHESSNVLVKDYLHIINRVWLILPCNYTVHYVGSALKKIYTRRRNRYHRNAFKELFIHWNGSHFNKDDIIAYVRQRFPLKECSRKIVQKEEEEEDEWCLAKY